MTRLSVNLNKVALIRNARGANLPDLLKFAKDCESYGAQGITVHPRPDERHIRRKDVYDLKPIVETEFNIEGYPTEDFLEMVCELRPHQCTLVPDTPDALTSNQGWETIERQDFLKKVIEQLHSAKIRASLFIDPQNDLLRAAKDCGTDRVEFYTGPYAQQFPSNPELAIGKYRDAAVFADSIDLEINAGHDLNLDNLKFFKKNTPNLLEVSIGQALISDCLYYGLENTIQMYRRELDF